MDRSIALPSTFRLLALSIAVSLVCAISVHAQSGTRNNFSADPPIPPSNSSLGQTFIPFAPLPADKQPSLPQPLVSPPVCSSYTTSSSPYRTRHPSIPQCHANTSCAPPTTYRQTQIRPVYPSAPRRVYYPFPASSIRSVPYQSAIPYRVLRVQPSYYAPAYLPSGPSCHGY